MGGGTPSFLQRGGSRRWRGRGAKRWEGERRKWRPRGRRECAEDRGGVLKRERVQRDPWPRRREARRREPLHPTQRTREEGRGPGPLAAARRSSVTRPPRADALTGRGLHVSGSAKACGSDPGEGGPRWRKRRSLPETQGQQRPGPWWAWVLRQKGPRVRQMPLKEVGRRARGVKEPESLPHGRSFLYPMPDQVPTLRLFFGLTASPHPRCFHAFLWNFHSLSFLSSSPAFC